MKIAIIGASGLVGRNVLKQLLRFSSKHEILLYTSKNSAGKIIENYKCEELSDKTIQKVDVAIFSAGGSVSKEWAEKFTNLGAFVVDNSNAFRREKSVPLVVPEINASTINKTTKIIANPNCSTIQIALPLYYLNKQTKIERVIISTYQSVSGAGQKGVLDLENDTSNKFPYKIKNNLIPQIDIPLENGYTLEEDKMNFELKKILNEPNIMVTATAVRVPVKNCHGASVYVEFENKMDIKTAKEILSNATGIVVQDDLNNSIYPMPINSIESPMVYVGRLRQDLNNPNAICFWCVSDNLYKGASTNALQIMEIVEKFTIKN